MRTVMLIAALVCSSAFAQYPSKPIRVILPFPPGSLLDGFARSLWQQTGLSALVENRPGASQIVGMSACARAPADGYTLCMTTADGIVYNPLLVAKLPYDPDADFAPVTHLVSFPSVIVASSASPFGSFKEMVAYARANPGKVNFGTWGAASIPDIYASWIMQRTGTRFTAIPYKGAGQAWPALLAGEMHATMIGPSVALPAMKAGKARPLAVIGPRLAELPGVPTLADEGADAALNLWFGLFAPGTTSRAIVDRLHAEVTSALRTPKIQEYMRAQILIPVGSSPAEFAVFLAKEKANATRVFNALGIKPGETPQ